MTDTETISNAQRRALLAIACTEIILGAFILRATLVHTAAYPTMWQWRLDLLVSTLLLVTGLGLLRRRRWAIMISTGFIYLAFLAVLITLYIGFEHHTTTPWYWLLLLALPVLGACRLVLRDAATRR